MNYTMNKYRFTLEPYNGINSRYHCPKCNDKVKTFTRYIDLETGKYLDLNVGYCNRVDKCGYHYPPKDYFKDNKILIDYSQKLTSSPPKSKFDSVKRDISYISSAKFQASLQKYEENNFVQYLNTLFGAEVTNDLIIKYRIGTSKQWNGATIFWQIDVKDKIRTGKIMQYDSKTGKRIKTPFNKICWVHKLLKNKEFELGQCLFGEHLLIDKLKNVVIVESEKTAVIASEIFKDDIWLATGGKNNWNIEKFKVLKNRNVLLIPDLNGFKEWNIKKNELSKIANVSIFDYIEINATEEDKKHGLDLADFLIKELKK